MKTKQKRLLYKKILSLLNKGDCLFLTFTFNEKTMKKITESNRLRYIKRFLNEQTSDYILNKDYGHKNGREHYHAIVKAKYRNMLYLKAYKIGTITAEKIKLIDRYTKQERSLEDIAKDLTEHATKESTQNNKIIYSRPHRKALDFRFKPQIDAIILNAEINHLKKRSHRKHATRWNIKHLKAQYRKTLFAKAQDKAVRCF